MWPCDFWSVTKAVDLWLEVMSVTSRQKVSDGVCGSALSLLCCDHQECPTERLLRQLGCEALSGGENVA